ncbi:MAG: hypothetical protein DME08_15435 [Candidatus Rokuibacteriota bacterium]|nr:MAG: hypothetical protein DME08_15435 [Candidatus Rokubacteria bacterium]
MSTRVAEVDERRILFANTETLLWPEANISKGDLIDYYVELAGVVLPFLALRPLSLLRCPDGVAGECVYQKTAPPGLPQWIPTRRVRSDQAALGYAEYVIGSERAALAYLVNLGYTSFHPWACLVDAVDRPDLMLFDLDPTEIAFREVRNAALLVRSLLAGFKIRSWVKTSGGAGVHVIVPLDPVYSFEQTLTAASTIPYAVREYPGAPVATPLEWSDLERSVYPEDFHFHNVRERLRQRGDPLRGLFAERQSLAPLLEGGRARRARPIA